MAKARIPALFALVLCTWVADGARAADPSLKIVEFTADWCKPCQSMQPAMTKLAREGWQVSHVNVDQDADLVRTFQVKSVPTIVIVRQGQEVDRIVGALGYEKLLARFDAASASSAPETVRGQSPAPIAAFPLLGSGGMGSVGATAPTRAAAPMSGAPTASAPMPSALMPGPQMSSARTPVTRELTEAPLAQAQPAALGQAMQTRPAGGRPLEQAMAIAGAATVRIRIEETNAVSFGTGTVIDVHGNQALVLTCGHLFRDIKPDAQLSVDVYYNGQPVTVSAHVVSYNLKDCDIGLIEFPMPRPIEPVQVAPLNEQPAVGDLAFSYGCDHGADPTRRDTQIKHVNRYLGAANVEIHGAPVVGRSGGGLFDAQGRLIGVCNAADEDDNEGIYAALPIVHEHIAGLKLQELDSGSQLAVAPSASSQPVPAQLAVAATAPVQMASLRDNSPERTPATGEGEYWPDQIAAASTATSAQRGAAPSAAAQLHCVVRDASGQESHITIDRPSPELIAALRQHAQR